LASLYQYEAVKTYSIPLFWASVPFLTLAQHQKQQVVWYGYFITIPIADKWYNVTEIQNRQLIAPF
jgi:hypothetical protein